MSRTRRKLPRASSEVRAATKPTKPHSREKTADHRHDRRRAKQLLSDTIQKEFLND